MGSKSDERSIVILKRKPVRYLSPQTYLYRATVKNSICCISTRQKIYSSVVGSVNNWNQIARAYNARANVCSTSNIFSTGYSAVNSSLAPGISSHLPSDKCRYKIIRLVVRVSMVCMWKTNKTWTYRRISMPNSYYRILMWHVNSSCSFISCVVGTMCTSIKCNNCPASKPLKTILPRIRTVIIKLIEELIFICIDNWNSFNSNRPALVWMKAFRWFFIYTEKNHS